MAAIAALAIEELALTWLETDPVGRILVDDELRVLWSNGAAKRCFELDVDLELRDGLLATYNRNHQQGLNNFLANVEEELQTYCVPCEDRDGHFLFRARQVAAHSGHRYLGVTFHRSGRNFIARYADLREAFQLTPSELKILDQMLDGSTADEISSAVGLSIDTVRSHIRNIYTKVGVKSRERLFARLHAYRI